MSRYGFSGFNKLYPDPVRFAAEAGDAAADGDAHRREKQDKLSAQVCVAVAAAAGISEPGSQGGCIRRKCRNKRLLIAGHIDACRTVSVCQQGGDRIKVESRKSAAVYKEIVGGVAVAYRQRIVGGMDGMILADCCVAFVKVRIENRFALIVPCSIHMVILSVNTNCVPCVSLRCAG